MTIAQVKVHRQPHGLNSKGDGRHWNLIMIRIRIRIIIRTGARRAAHQNQNRTACRSECPRCSSDACRSSWGNVHNQFGMHLLGHISWAVCLRKCTELTIADHHFCCKRATWKGYACLARLTSLHRRPPRRHRPPPRRHRPSPHRHHPPPHWQRPPPPYHR